MSDNYIRDGKYLFLRLEAEPGFDGGYEFRMISNNQPEMLVKLLVNREGRTTHLDYNVTGLVPLKSLEEELDGFLYAVISGLEKLGEVLPEYLLSPDRISLLPEQIFVRRETGQVYFCYVPGREASFGDSLAGLMEYFIKNASPADSEEVLLLYGLYQKSREETAGPGTLAEYWREQKKNRRPEENVFPMPEEAEIEFPDADIYAELGMEEPKPKLLRNRRKKEKEAGTALPEERLLPEKPRGVKLPAAKSGGKNMGGDGDEAPKTLGRKIAALFKKHKAEFIVAAVVIVGAILILLR